MSDTSGLIKIADVVDRFLFKSKLPKDDFVVFMEHAADCYRDINLYHGKSYRQEKLTADSLGRINMPNDLIELIGVYVPWRGQEWWFTYNNKMVTTTTLVNGSDTYDTTYGEGMNIQDDTSYGYGATGGKNQYYMKPDFRSRIIYLTSMENTQCTVVYISSGLSMSGDTYIEASAQSVFDTYLRWQSSIINGEQLGIQRERERNYDNAVLMFRRLNMPSANEMRDQFYRMFVQAPYR